MYDALKNDIPLPKAVYTLSSLFSQHNITLFAVGGVVRDYLFSKFHGGDFDPKDVDLATEADPAKVSSVLRSSEAAALGIHCFPKGESFGVISAVVDGVEYEIATFREEWYDPESGDGRRPDQVKFSTPENDAKRRDLTINALFYDLDKKEIRDYNLDEQGHGFPSGQGFADIKNLVVRPVGNAHDRFREDKLRILRLVRFFCRFNGGSIAPNLDKETHAAINKFRNLKGVSPERIANEFTAGLAKCLNPANYVANYGAMGLFPALFPDLNGRWGELSKIGDCRNLKAVLAWILHQCPMSARRQLNDQKYPNDVSDRVDFLLKLYFLNEEERQFNITDVSALIRRRDLYKQLEGIQREETWETLQKDVRDFAKIAGKEKEMEFFLNYQPIARSQDFLHLSGKAISEAMKKFEAENYWKLWVK